MTQVFSSLAAFSLLYFPASVTTDAGVAYSSSLTRIVCEHNCIEFCISNFYQKCVFVFQSGFHSDDAVPLNNEAFMAMMSTSCTGGLTVGVNVMTR